MCKDNDFPTEMRAFNIKAKKRDLGKAKREIRKKVAELKEVNGVAQFLKELIDIAQFFEMPSCRRVQRSTAHRRRCRKISTRHSRI